MRRRLYRKLDLAAYALSPQFAVVVIVCALGLELRSESDTAGAERADIQYGFAAATKGGCQG